MAPAPNPPGTRAVGVDLGARRIGIAVSDSAGILASPLCTIDATGNEAADLGRIVDIVGEERAGYLVIGLPLTLDGGIGQAAEDALRVVVALRRLVEPLGVAVETCDERLTTVRANTAMLQAGRPASSRRKVIDQAAAATMLQTWLDTRVGLR